jgi:hypothetical protein
MSAIDTAEFRKLTLLAAGIDPTEIPPILDTAEWRRLLIVAIEQATAGGGGSGTVTSVTATSPIASTGGATPVISTNMATNRLLGRSAAGTGIAQEISIGTGLSLSAGTLSNAGVLSDTTVAQGGTQLLNMVRITQAAYDAIATPSQNTLYIIVL